MFALATVVSFLPPISGHRGKRRLYVRPVTSLQGTPRVDDYTVAVDNESDPNEIALKGHHSKGEFDQYKQQT